MSISFIDTETLGAEVDRSCPNNIDRVNAITEENLKQGKIISERLSSHSIKSFNFNHNNIFNYIFTYIKSITDQH